MPANVKQQIKSLVKAFDAYAAGAKSPTKTESDDAKTTKFTKTAQTPPTKTTAR